MNYTIHGILQDWSDLAAAAAAAAAAFPFSSGFSQPRVWTHVSHIAGGVFTSWATGEALMFCSEH